MATVLMVPGFTGSGPGHWQRLWHHDDPASRWVEQRDWDRPDPDAWVTALDRAVHATAPPVVLVGHSLGCITIVRWAEVRPAHAVAAAMLVAPADVEAPAAPAAIRCFAPIPMRRLPFPTVVVASADDPLLAPTRAEQLTSCWRARLVSVGPAGHINTASGHGEWPEGRRLLTGVLTTVSPGRLTDG